MKFASFNCEKCFHNKICLKKEKLEEYMELYTGSRELIEDLNKKHNYDMFYITIECGDYISFSLEKPTER